MNSITRINHIGLRVSDFETACEFYSKLGFKYITGPGGPEPVAIVQHPSGININFILNTTATEKYNVLMEGAIKYTGYTHIAIEVSSAEAVLKELNDVGIALSEGAHRHPTGTSLFIRDPDNNVIEFIEYAGLAAFQ
jgi:lactoylglutathione lyase